LRVAASLADALHARAKSSSQRHCDGSMDGRKRIGESRSSSQPGTFDNTPGPASGAT
jgi:hypothetical protein